MTNVANTMSAEENKFLETVIQDPDNKDVRGGIPDFVDGYSFTRTQTISTQIDSSGTALTGNTYDVWIVDWDFESTTPITANYRVRDNDPNFQDVWDTNVSATLPIGGVQVYVMQPGNSPFPSNDPAITGPVAPLKTIGLNFDNSVFSGTTRVVGKDIECQYTAPEISAQGLWTQGTYASYDDPCNVILYNNADPIAGAHAFPGDCVAATRKQIPPGSVNTIVKYPNSVQRPAFDGILQAANMHMHDNFPTLPRKLPRVYQSTIFPTGANNALDLHVCNIPNGNAQNYTTGFPVYWDSHSDIHYAVCTGLTKDATLQLWRTLTTETFPDPSDSLISFAKRAPLVNMHALEVCSNAVRSQPQFWASGDNAFGGFAKALKGGFKAFKKVGMGGLRVAAVSNPAAAAALNQANSMKAQAKQMQSAFHNNNNNMHMQEESQLAKAKRNRSKPANKQKPPVSMNSKGKNAASGTKKKK